MLQGFESRQCEYVYGRKRGLPCYNIFSSMHKMKDERATLSFSHLCGLSVSLLTALCSLSLPHTVTFSVSFLHLFSSFSPCVHSLLYIYIHLTHPCPFLLAHCIMHSLFSRALLRAASAVQKLWLLQRLEWLKPGKNKPFSFGGACEIETTALPDPLPMLMISCWQSLFSPSFFTAHQRPGRSANRCMIPK